MLNAQIGAFAVAVTTIVGATVAVCLGHIDTTTYVALVGPFGGGAAAAGIHASGVQTGQSVSTPAAKPALPTSVASG